MQVTVRIHVCQPTKPARRLLLVGKTFECPKDLVSTQLAAAISIRDVKEGLAATPDDLSDDSTIEFTADFFEPPL